MDLIESIRQMMAEDNFSAAEIALENVLATSPNLRNEVIPLYLESLQQQKKSLPVHLVTEIINELWEKNPEEAINVFFASPDSLKNSDDSRILFFRMRLAENRGHVQELHELISNFHIRLFERSLPAVPTLITGFVQKYFRTDFQIQLQTLALTLLRKSLGEAEEQIKKLILEAHEKSSPKILREKLSSLQKVLHAQNEKGHLEIYESFLSVLLNGFQEKKDYKRLAEAVIYFDDFRFGIILMNYIHRSELSDYTSDYAQELIIHPQYDFVYIAKYFPDLKRFFVNMTQKVERQEEWEVPELELESEPVKAINFPEASERSEDEQLLIQLVKNQEFTDHALLDLAVSFLQSELPRVALSAALTVHARAADDRMKLKAAYLALTSLLQTGDNRKALDLALESMKIVKTTDDLLSFLYCEAEAYLRLNMKKEARQVLSKILSIDSGYRMARERLEQLE